MPRSHFQMALSTKKSLEAIASKSVLEISELIKLMEESSAFAAARLLSPLLLALPPRPLKQVRVRRRSVRRWRGEQDQGD